MSNANWEEPHKGLWNRMVNAQESAGLGVTQEEIGKSAGTKQSSAHRWKTGQGLPTLRQAITFAVTTGVRVDWLLTGRGTMYPQLAHGGEDDVLRETLDSLDKKTREDVIRYAQFRKHQTERT